MTTKKTYRTALLLAAVTTLMWVSPGQAQVPGDAPPMIDGVYRNLHWPSRNEWFTYGPPARNGYKVYAPNPDLQPIAAYVSPRGLPIKPNPTAARIEVKAPANAEIFIEDQKSEQTGPVRTFISPPLKRDRQYTYSIRAEWMQDQQPRTATRQVTFRSGEAVTVDLSAVLPERATAQR